MSFCDEKMRRLEQAKEKIRGFDGSVFTDYALFIAACNGLFDAAESWYGKALLDDFHLMEWYKLKCPRQVNKEYTEYIANEDIDEMGLTAADFEMHLKKAWKRASKKGSLYVAVPLNTTVIDQSRRPLIAMDLNKPVLPVQKSASAGQGELQDIN